MDTWTADGGSNRVPRMWLRDLLPTSDYFAKGRVMTFGYDSDLTDRQNKMSLEDWATTLLTSVSGARTFDAVLL